MNRARRCSPAWESRARACTTGYDREFPLIPHVASALGVQFTLYGAPSSLEAIYGAHPAGVVLFLRLRAAP